MLTATSGEALATSDTATAIVRHLFPLATLITPNIFEAARLSGKAIAPNRDGIRHAAIVLHARGAKAMLVEGGHVAGAASDDLFFDGESFTVFSAPRIQTRNRHGTGCTLSSAIAAYLARGYELAEAIGAGKTYLSDALAAADALKVGHGAGPINHFHDFWKR